MRSWKKWQVISMTTTDVWVEGINPGYRTKIIKIGNCTVEINRPILTDEERQKREAEVIKALSVFGRSVANGL